MMKKTLAVLLSAALCVSLFAGCSGGSANTSDPESTTPATGTQTAEETKLSGTVVTNGSTSMESVMGALIEAFKEVQPDVQIQYTGSGSGAGITSAQDGTADIGLASRDLKDDETGVKQITVAKDGIAIIV
ncbi:MAG TPA: substrate-binding domain-containing protein, partial [Candidatus Intestinimonas merdavium]|nr:substrate-binding domain-containing protein [Candidatus Intestinimonas merdavium]